MTTPTGPQTAAQDPYAGAPDMEAEASALVALAAALNGSVDRSAAAVRPLAIRKAAWLDRAALADPENAHGVTLAETAALELLAHDWAFGTALTWVDWDAPRLYVRAAWRRLDLADAAWDGRGIIHTPGGSVPGDTDPDNWL